MTILLFLHNMIHLLKTSEDWTMDGGEGEGEGSGEGSWGNVDMDAFCQENPTHHNCADDDWEGADMDAFCEENPTSSYCD